MEEVGSENKTQRWVIIGCVSVAVILFCCAASVIGGLYWLGSQTTDGLAQIDVNAPTSVEQGQEYVITVEINNVSGEDITLNSIDIQATLLDGFIINTVEPSYIETYEYGFSESDIYQTFSFLTAIPPGESLSVTFTGEAVIAGDFSGEFDVCIDSSVNCKTEVIRTIVR